MLFPVMFGNKLLKVTIVTTIGSRFSSTGVGVL